MRCASCEWKYPDNLLHNMIINGERTEPICGICALNLQNEASGEKRDSFVGRLAEAIRLGAIKWREDHPADKPITH